ncbi:MAG TPA: aminopeptidase N [Gammaproteobacteria bacterium]|nr:aminopeptidase N [Gammaproteobacteria bacterium]
MKEGSPRVIYLKDYRPPAFWIDSVDLHFDLREGETTVSSRIAFRRNGEGPREPLRLDGVDLTPVSVSIDGRELTAEEYRIDAEGLILPETPDEFVFESVVKIHPEENTSLEGLYQSSGNYCTQCEAHGFRKITWFLDRPDVMTVFTTTIEADKARFPVLLSNGNPVDSGDAGEGRHWAKWHDPFRKPSYLFALVAGDLAVTEGSFTTRSGREAALRIYTEHHNAHRTAHALRSLEKAMRWDEERFGLEYDLDLYMIVAVDDFNMGAMENKGLNIFNSKFVLALPETATDTDFVNIEAVIAHEYFHNWTGNRVTCRDWFQLSLKEGLTVFRDQSFTADMTSPAVKRIDDVRMLRSVQFAEDASPMAHPVRPDSYIEINNFYTVTVYEKGAEVVRMYQTLLGREGFRKGMDLYFQRHDGQAVTTDDFRHAMADANGVDLEQFQRWYEQAGTPRVAAESAWNAETGDYSLTFSQQCPEGQDEAAFEPMMIPVRVALLSSDGAPIESRLKGGETVAHEHLLVLTESRQRFVFTGLDAEPTPSLLRDFSAPVILEYDYSDEALGFLAAHDSDAFNRWEAGQRLATRVLLERIQRIGEGRTVETPDALIEAWRHLLDDRESDRALLAEALVLPGEAYLAEQVSVIRPDIIHQARQGLIRELAERFEDALRRVYDENRDEDDFALDAASMGRRRLKNVVLGLMTASGSAEALTLALDQFRGATNMTDAMGALSALADHDREQRRAALAEFHERWRDDSLVMDKWFAAQAGATLPGVVDEVRRLMEHPLFTIKNPNKVRALIGAFAANPTGFHAADGTGYRFVGEQIQTLDSINPQVAARLAKQFTRWRHYDDGRQALMRKELEGLQARPGLSRDVYEIVSRSLKA